MKTPALAPLLACILLPAFARAQDAADGEKVRSDKPAENIVSLRIESKGDSHWVKIRLNDEQAPRHCENFRKLAGQNFFEGIAVHRVIPNYIVQMGDPLTRDESQKEHWGTGGVGYNIPPEIGLPHRSGSVGMARLQSGNPKRLSSGSQFYVMLTDAPELDKEYTVFGEVVEGLDVLADISRSHADTNNLPVHRVEITASKIGEPGLMATVTKPISALPRPKMPEIKNPLSGLRNPFRRKYSEEDGFDGLLEDDANGNGDPAADEKTRSSPPPGETRKTEAGEGTATGDVAPPPEPEKKKGPFGRLWQKVW